MAFAHFGITLVSAALLALGPGTAAAQGEGPPPGLPSVPTTKVLALGRVSGTWTPETMRTVMPPEVRATVQLYLDGKLDQWFVRKDQRGVVFFLNVTTVEEAHDMLEALPLGQAKLMEFDLIPLGPLAPLALLTGDPAP